LSLLVNALIVWNILLTLLFLFDKSRIDCVEKSMGSVVRYLTNEMEGENDWR